MKIIFWHLWPQFYCVNIAHYYSLFHFLLFKKGERVYKTQSQTSWTKEFRKMMHYLPLINNQVDHIVGKPENQLTLFLCFVLFSICCYSSLCFLSQGWKKEYLVTAIDLGLTQTVNCWKFFSHWLLEKIDLSVRPVALVILFQSQFDLSQISGH